MNILQKILLTRYARTFLDHAKESPGLIAVFPMRRKWVVLHRLLWMDADSFTKEFPPIAKSIGATHCLARKTIDARTAKSFKANCIQVFITDKPEPFWNARPAPIVIKTRQSELDPISGSDLILPPSLPGI